MVNPPEGEGSVIMLFCSRSPYCLKFGCCLTMSPNVETYL